MVGRPYFPCAWYLAGVVIVEPALQVDGIPAWHQTAILEDPQFYRRVVACGDDVMERVLQCHWVIVGSLVLLAGSEEEEIKMLEQPLYIYMKELTERQKEETQSAGVRPGTRSKLCQRD